jgi:SAM-dependent methyltransferase
MDIRNYAGYAFDYIVSFSAFEHIIELDKVLDAMKNNLKSKGRIYVGFGPLWNSPFGDHRRTKTIIPWGHLLFSESLLITKLNLFREKKINSIYDLGLNKLSLSDYRRMFRNSGLQVKNFKINVSDNFISKIFSVIRKIPFLEEYFTHNIYCIWENRSKKAVEILNEI